MTALEGRGLRQGPGLVGGAWRVRVLEAGPRGGRPGGRNWRGRSLVDELEGRDPVTELEGRGLRQGPDLVGGAWRGGA